MSRVLLVDDDPLTIQIARLALEDAGIEVISTEVSGRALELATEHEVDLVVLDIQMPGRSGFEILEELRSLASTQDVPILMLSSRGAVADRIEGLRAGADDYLPKPFDPIELTLRVDRLVAQRANRALVGRIESFAVSDLVQSLVETRKSGFLVVGAGRLVGRFVVADGALRSASYGRLVGREAAIAVLELDSGRFEFVTRKVTAPTMTWQLQEIELRSVLLETAWLADELNSRRPLLASPTTLLQRTADGLDGQTALASAQGAAELARLPELPLSEVLSALDRSTVSEEKLIEALPFAPNRIRLALALLGEVQLVGPVPQ